MLTAQEDWRSKEKMEEEKKSGECIGLPPEICSELTKEQELIKIKVEKRRFGKEVTIVEGIEGNNTELKKIASMLKSKLAAGGSAKDNKIIIQGDHREKIKEILMELGYPEENIIIIE
jgi:translation initiation factor 1